MTKKLSIDLIMKLYEEYVNDLAYVRDYERRLYHEKGYSRLETSKLYRMLRYAQKKFGFHPRSEGGILRPQLDDIEAEVTYLLMREFRPENTVEISPCGGWSTSWILNAIKDNRFGRCYSYDIIDISTRVIPPDLSADNWIFIKGDVKENIDKLPRKIDYLFIDSDHSAEFAKWYIQTLFPKLRSGTPVSVHGVFHTTDPSQSGGEGKIIIDWSKRRGIEYFTVSKAKDRGAYQKIMLLKDELNIGKEIAPYPKDNPMIFFVFRP